MTPDLYGAWLTAGNTLQPVGDWLVAHAPGLAAAVAALGIACWAIRRHLRRIAALPVVDPDIARTADRYLRDTGEETP